MKERIEAKLTLNLELTEKEKAYKVLYMDGGTMTLLEAQAELGYSRTWLSELIKRGVLVIEDGEITKESVMRYKERPKKTGRPLGSFNSSGGNPMTYFCRDCHKAFDEPNTEGKK